MTIKFPAVISIIGKTLIEKRISRRYRHYWQDANREEKKKRISNDDEEMQRDEYRKRERRSNDDEEMQRDEQ